MLERKGGGRLRVHVIVPCTCDLDLRAQMIGGVPGVVYVYMWSGFACADDPWPWKVCATGWEAEQCSPWDQGPSCNQLQCHYKSWLEWSLVCVHGWSLWTRPREPGICWRRAGKSTWTSGFFLWSSPAKFFAGRISFGIKTPYLRTGNFPSGYCCRTLVEIFLGKTCNAIPGQWCSQKFLREGRPSLDVLWSILTRRWNIGAGSLHGLPE